MACADDADDADVAGRDDAGRTTEDVTSARGVAL
jgi:hypothetical protein